MSFFSAEHINAGYGKQSIVKDVSFTVEEGCLLGLLGANGSGKTTLLKAVCGILPHEGRCLLDGSALETMTARQIAGCCSYIPQRSGISIDISALDVVLMGFNPRLGLLEHPGSAMRESAMRALAQVGLAGKEEMNYLHLSEGQKQLCILARTLVSGSSFLLLDEPESALDFRFRCRMLELLRRWLAEGKRGALVTLHDPTLAPNYCDKLLLLDRGTLVGTIDPRSDSLDEMERMMSTVYGPVSLHRCQSRKGRRQLVMLKEDEG